jgi:hypothetical protein
MANVFSDNLAATPSGAYTASYRRNGAATHARMRKKRMVLATGAIITAADTSVMGTFKSNDRLYDLRLSTNVGTTAGNVDIGLYKAAFDHVPVAANAIDPDLFSDALSVISILDRAEALVQDGVIEDWQRGLTLWEMADHGGGSYSVDPMEDWDLVMTHNATTDAAQIFLLEADYVSFG